MLPASTVIERNMIDFLVPPNPNKGSGRHTAVAKRIPCTLSASSGGNGYSKSPGWLVLKKPGNNLKLYHRLPNGGPEAKRRSGEAFPFGRSAFNHHKGCRPSNHDAKANGGHLEGIHWRTFLENQKQKGYRIAKKVQGTMKRVSNHVPWTWKPWNC